MAVGARDHIDKLLVQKYQTLQVDNHENINQLSEDDVLNSLQQNANAEIAMRQYENKLKKLGQQLLAKKAYKNYRYIPTNF